MLSSTLSMLAALVLSNAPSNPPTENIRPPEASVAVGQDRGEVIAKKAGKALDAYLEDCEAFGFSGAVLVQRKGKIVLRKGYGLARPGTEIANTPETLFDLASGSKQITAAAILLLESEGKLSLEDSIAKHLPGVPERHREITLFHLLTHTSGFSRYGSAGHGDDLEVALQGYFRADRSRKSGEAFEYYNGGYAMLAGVVEQVTGEAFEDWVAANLFERAGMEGTDFLETARVDEDLISSSHDTGKRTTDYLSGWAYRGMGGVLTSVSDLALWCNALFGGEILPKDALSKMLTPHKAKYALGWYVFETDKGREVVQHSGGGAKGFESYIRYFPKEDVLILVMTNRSGWGWQSAWGMTSVLFDSRPETLFLPEVKELRSSDLDRYCAEWHAGNETLVIERTERGLEVGAIGTQVVANLGPGQGQSPAPKKNLPGATSADLQEAEAVALAMLHQLVDGETELLASNLAPHIPSSWPKLIATKLWPQFVERWGKVGDMQVLGSFFDAEVNRIRVWVRVDTESGARSIEVAFKEGKLNILDLNALGYPAMAHLAPVSGKRLVGYDFQEKSPFELTVSGKGNSRKLTLRFRDRESIEFTLSE